MGRMHNLEQMPRHHRHVRASRGETPAPRSLAVRRPLSGGCINPIIRGIEELKQRGEIPPTLKVNSRAGIELVPELLIGKQALKGLVRVSQDESNKLANKALSLVGGNAYQVIATDMKAVSMKRGGSLRITLESTALETEREILADVLEQRGFRGMHRHRQQTALHINFASGGRAQLTHEERIKTEASVTNLVELVHEFQEPLLFGPWDIFPGLQQEAA